jgi:hypothetical protein
MLIGSVFVGVISYYLNSYYTGKNLGYGSWMQLKDVAPSYGIAIVIAICIYFIKFLPLSYWLVLFVQFFIGSICFILINEKVKLSEYLEIKQMLISCVQRILFKKRDNE